MEMKAKATDNVTSVKLNVIKLFTCTQVLVLEIRKNVIEIGIRVLKVIHRINRNQTIIYKWIFSLVFFEQKGNRNLFKKATVVPKRVKHYKNLR